MTILCANTELVAAAWLGTLPGLDPSMVATQLPDDNSSWAASGFLVIVGAGGSPNPDVPMRAPIVGTDSWAVAPSSNKPPWGKANHLVETVLAATYQRNLTHRRVVLPGAYPPVFVHSALIRGEPRRVPGDPGGAAHYTMNLQLYWTQVGP